MNGHHGHIVLSRVVKEQAFNKLERLTSLHLTLQKPIQALLFGGAGRTAAPLVDFYTTVRIGMAFGLVKDVAQALEKRGEGLLSSARRAENGSMSKDSLLVVQQCFLESLKLYERLATEKPEDVDVQRVVGEKRAGLMKLLDSCKAWIIASE